MMYCRTQLKHGPSGKTFQSDPVTSAKPGLRRLAESGLMMMTESRAGHRTVTCHPVTGCGPGPGRATAALRHSTEKVIDRRRDPAARRRSAKLSEA